MILKNPVTSILGRIETFPYVGALVSLLYLAKRPRQLEGMAVMNSGLC